MNKTPKAEKASQQNIIVLLIGYIDYDSRVQKEISNFISLGYNVTLVVWNLKPSVYDNEKIKIIDLNLSNYTFHTNRFSKLLRFIRFVKFWFLASNIIKRGEYRYIHCNDLLTLGVLFFLPKIFYKKVSYDAHDMIPEMYKEKSLKYRIWSFIERHLVNKIDVIIVPESHRARYLKKKYNLKARPYVINNYPVYRNVVPKNIKKELHIAKENTAICYNGVIRRDRDLEKIINSLKFLSEDCVLVLIGYAIDNYLDELKETINRGKLGNRVFFYGEVQPEEMLQTISGCDVTISFYQNDSINNYLCASNKVFDSIMAGVKVLTNDYPPHGILKKYEFVGLISENEPEEIAQSLRNLSKCDSDIPECIKWKFSWESQFGLFKQIYK